MKTLSADRLSRLSPFFKGLKCDRLRGPTADTVLPELLASGCGQMDPPPPSQSPNIRSSSFSGVELSRAGHDAEADVQ